MKNFKNSPWDDFEEEEKENIFNKKRRKEFNFNQLNFDPKWVIYGLIFLLLAWLGSGIYKVEEGQRAIILRFGKYNRDAFPGLNYHLPNPLEHKIIEKVDQSRRVEVGYRSVGSSKFRSVSSYTDVKSESLMLTGDENIMELNVDAMWHINDLAKYVFHIDYPRETVKAVAESAIREVIGNTPIIAVLSNQKQAIANKIEKLMQATLDHYQSGVQIEQVKLLKAEPPKEVIASYRDVQNAKADKEKSINEAEAYLNDVLPRARGEAERIKQAAQGYKEEVVANAKGNSARFNALFKEYLSGKEVTKTRLYLEYMEKILEHSNKVIMGNENMLPHMAIKNQKNLVEN